MFLPYPRSSRTLARTAGVIICLTLVAASTLGVRGSSPTHRARLALELLKHEARGTTAHARVIVRGSPDETAAIAARHQLTVVRTLGDFAVVAANSAQVSELAADPAVETLSGDLPVRLTMSVSNISSGASQVRVGAPGLLGIGGIAAVNGQGIGVAVLDTGVSAHAALKNVVANVSFVSGNTKVVDEYGHGTHVAGIIGGSASAASKVTSLYTGGIAPGVQIVNVRVLGPDGTGLTSDVIAGIEWVLTNRARYNIRVMNLSLGHPVTEPAATDPLCLEVAKAASAGIVVVVSAGNAGKAASGAPVLGGIASPGNSPYALTVGALNTWQTTNRSDDSVTTYSSRGPTKYDLAVKPDLVAPGNKIVSLEANGSSLSVDYSVLHVAGSGTNAYMRMSGTSMATPMVSGGVALLLQGTPGLNPAQVKIALQSGASYLPDAGLMGGGAGSVNFWEARKTTANGLTSLLGRITGSLLGPTGAFYWDAGTMTRRLYNGNGLRLLGLLDLSLVWGNTSLLRWDELNLVGLTNPLALIPANNLIWGQVATWTSSSQIMWGDTIYDPTGQQIMWGDSDPIDEYQIMWGDSVLTSPDPS